MPVRHASSRQLGTLIVLTIVGAGLAGCSSPSLMQAPVALRSVDVDPYAETPADRRSDVIELFYATDRDVRDETSLDRFGSGRGHVLRLGAADVMVGPGNLSWSELLDESLAARRRRAIGVELVGLEEIGPLQESIFFLDPAYETPPVAEQAFARAINERLAGGPSRDVYVYVAQFRANFDEALFIASEFSFFMGRPGATIAYSWPTSRRSLSYLSATENAYYTVRNLRELLVFLADETDAHRIHLLTYSAGARVVSYALDSLRRASSELDEAAVRERYRIGQVILTGPDIDQHVFRDHYQDGMAEIAEQITIYMTEDDQALGVARWLFGQERLGSVSVADFVPGTIEYLEQQENTNLVVVENAENFDEGNAHGYFRNSPWVSSDLILAWRFGLSPSERGLVRKEGGVWAFPDDYPTRATDVAAALFAPARPRR